nr:MAG TPA: hypothetical protein [Caudoviricetes sp.]
MTYLKFTFPHLNSLPTYIILQKFLNRQLKFTRNHKNVVDRNFWRCYHVHIRQLGNIEERPIEQFDIERGRGI